MLEIKKRNDNWEAYINGALYHYEEFLVDLLRYLHKNSEEVTELANED